MALLSHDLWVRRFGSSREAIGKLLTLNGHPFTIVGVMPASFAYPSPDTAIWIPLGLDPADPGGRFSHYLTVIGRLKPAVSLEQAQRDLAGVTPRVALSPPRSPGGAARRVGLAGQSLDEPLEHRASRVRRFHPALKRPQLPSVVALWPPLASLPPPSATRPPPRSRSSRHVR